MLARKMIVGMVVAVFVVVLLIAVEKGYAPPPEKFPPVAVLTADPVYAVIGEDIIFDGSDSEDQDPGPGNGITEYEWDFGDGNSYTETESNAPDGDFNGVTTYSYSSPGVYDVNLTVTDNDKPADSNSDIVKVYIRPLGDIYVPEDFDTIQDAIEAAVDGYTIVVSKGRQ